MSHLLLRLGAALLLIGLLLSPLTVSAHQSTPAGDYEMEYGWLNEPPIAGQPNAIVINILETRAEDHHPSTLAKISLMAPTEGATIEGDHVPVEVMVEGVSESEAHWHLYVDDQMVSMIPLDQTNVTLSGLNNGSHALKVSLAMSSHEDMGEPATAHITVEGAADSGNPKVEGVGSTDEHTHDEHEAFADVDVSGLKLEVVYGPESKALTLQPLGEETPGQFVAPLTPTRAGQYTLRLTGKIGDSDVGRVEVQPEEVESAEVVQFPSAAESGPSGELAAAKAQASTAQILAIIGIVLGALGIGVGAFAFARKK
jgi:hypothetical protein